MARSLPDATISSTSVTMDVIGGSAALWPRRRAAVHQVFSEGGMGPDRQRPGAEPLERRIVVVQLTCFHERRFCCPVGHLACKQLAIWTEIRPG